MNLNVHLHCLVLDGVYRTTASVPVFHAVRAPTAEEIQVLLSRIIKRLMKFLTRKGYLIEEQGMTYLADTGIHTTTRRAGSPSAVTPHPQPWCARAQRQAAH